MDSEIRRGGDNGEGGGDEDEMGVGFFKRGEEAGFVNSNDIGFPSSPTFVLRPSSIPNFRLLLP